MDGLDLLENVAFVGTVSSAIVFVIQFIKNLFQRASWKWCQKIPSEVWVILSVAMGIAAALAMNYDALTEAFGPTVPVTGTLAEVATGTLIGVSSKVVHAVATPIGAKLKEVKEGALLQTESLNKPSECSTGVTEAPPIDVTPVPPTNKDEVLLVKLSSVNPDIVIVNGAIYKVEQGETNA